MRKETRQRIVDYNVFIASDGKEFDNKGECKLHEMKLNGEIKECPNCGGSGKITKKEEYDNYHTGALEWAYATPTCEVCKGNGYLEKKTIWQ